MMQGWAHSPQGRHETANLHTTNEAPGTLWALTDQATPRLMKLSFRFIAAALAVAAIGWGIRKALRVPLFDWQKRLLSTSKVGC